jgi:hypothetical protein
MASKYKEIIEDYCVKHGISVPRGFGRHTPSRYAIIRTHRPPPKLIARTWAKAADLIYHIEHFLKPELGDTLPKSIRILDFQQCEELAYSGGKRFDKVGGFSVEHEVEPA